jgi:hypothetical protein
MLPAPEARCHASGRTARCCILSHVGTELFLALQTADPSVPQALETFDRVVVSDALGPDLYEYSVHVGSRFSPHRLTYYFDTHRRGADVAREAGDRLVRLCAELGLAIPSRLSAFVRSDLPRSSEVLQIVLGVEAPPQGSSLRA